jgi:hypothetical protein
VTDTGNSSIFAAALAAIAAAMGAPVVPVATAPGQPAPVAIISGLSIDRAANWDVAEDLTLTPADAAAFTARCAPATDLVDLD